MSVPNTRVTSVKVASIRPKYNNLREWIADTNNVYIGRKGVILLPNPETGKQERFPKSDSIWANPYKISGGESRETVISKYETYIRDRLKKEPGLLAELAKLRGKTLGCWCKPEGCHGDVLISLLNDDTLAH